MSYFTGVSRFILIRRLRWPAMILLTGVLALLDEGRILRWDQSWPLYLVVLGVLALAENVAWSEESAMRARMAQSQQAGVPQAGTNTGTGTAIVPAPPQEGQ